MRLRTFPGIAQDQNKRLAETSLQPSSASPRPDTLLTGTTASLAGRRFSVASLPRGARIARETMEVYVPIAHRLGLNNIYRELQDLSFSHLYPMRYRTLHYELVPG